MHRRLQFGMRENPASDRRHGSRFVISSEEFSNYAEESQREEPRPGVWNEDTATVSGNAAHLAATGEIKNLLNGNKLGGQLRRYRTERNESFEPLIGSGQAAKLLGNIHVKTLQRYARLGKLPGYQIGGHWYFRASDLDEWLQTQINSKSPTR